uniref:sigma 54-interacting transcriptional regulator n=2 Tax=Serratia TaxID=613 RepID=UPI0006666358
HAAAHSLSVLVEGETGSGKEVVAQLVHECSSRAGQPMVALNCAAVPENLIESELFGWQKGAFTGAHSHKEGLIARANGGTLFLDEVGDMPLVMQAKL